MQVLVTKKEPLFEDVQLDAPPFKDISEWVRKNCGDKFSEVIELTMLCNGYEVTKELSIIGDTLQNLKAHANGGHGEDWLSTNAFGEYTNGDVLKFFQDALRASSLKDKLWLVWY